MSDLQFTLDNVKNSPLQGFQLKAVAVSKKGYSQGFCTSFEALIDSGAFHTCISRAIMDDILETIFDENGDKLQEVGKSNAMGVYGKSNRESIYVLPHFYIGVSVK